ncbi:MAG: hypothetical protein RR811_07455 [Comamonas sp.]
MSTFSFHPPGVFRRSVFGGEQPRDNHRLKSFLILVGLGSIRRSALSKSTPLRHDFITIPFSAGTSPSISNIIAKFQGFSKGDLEKFFKNSHGKNLIYHKKIYFELVNAIGYFQEKNNISCFLHLYRIIEQSALCLPIISLMKNGNIENTFMEFKSLIKSDAKSDLSVLKNYSRSQKSTSPLQVTVNISFAHTTNPTQNIAIVRKLVKNIVSSTADSIELKYLEIDSLIIGFRNQFFHYLFHEDNLSLMDLTYPEEFLEVCNPIFINYFAFLFKDLLDAEMLMWD